MTQAEKATLQKAACLAVLYYLDQRGLLEGMTHQAIANLFGLGHRSTALRYMHDLEEVKRVIAQYLDQIVM